MPPATRRTSTMPTTCAAATWAAAATALCATCGNVGSETPGVFVDAAVDARDAAAALCNAADPDLVGCYEFEPASPSTQLTDSSVAANHGTLSGVTYVPGHDGDALELTAATSRVVIPESPSLDVASLTVELWIRTTTVPAAATRATLFNNDLQYTLSLLPGNVVECKFAQPSAATQLAVTSTVGVDLNAWAHVACTFDSAAGTGRAYLNGAAVAMGSAAPGSLATAPTDGSEVGGDSPCPAIPCPDAFTGDIDDLRIWKRERSPAEICADSGRTGC